MPVRTTSPAAVNNTSPVQGMNPPVTLATGVNNQAESYGASDHTEQHHHIEGDLNVGQGIERLLLVLSPSIHHHPERVIHLCESVFYCTCSAEVQVISTKNMRKICAMNETRT